MSILLPYSWGEEWGGLDDPIEILAAGLLLCDKAGASAGDSADQQGQRSSIIGGIALMRRNKQAREQALIAFALPPLCCAATRWPAYHRYQYIVIMKYIVPYRRRSIYQKLYRVFLKLCRVIQALGKAVDSDSDALLLVVLLQNLRSLARKGKADACNH